jgi:anti-anti-sigma factor
MTLTGVARSTRTDPGFVVSMSVEGASTVIALRGDADLTALPFLVDVLAGVIADREGAVIVDLAEAEFIDTASVRAVGLAAQCLWDDGRPMMLRSPSEPAVTLIETLGLSDLFEPEWVIDR